jgi:DNA-binding transcriptional MocR family regulator
MEHKMINLGRGWPDPALLPSLKPLLLSEEELMLPSEEALQYGEDQGSERIRQAIVSLRSGSSITKENILITNGSSQGLDMICLRFSKPGDIILVERLSYFYINSVLEQHGLVALQVPYYKDTSREETTGTLMDLDALEIALTKRQEKGQPIPKLLYTIPMCHNPTGATMEEVQARQLIDIARRFQFKIVSDEVYLFLGFNCETPPRSLLDYDNHGETETSVVLAVNSFSKILGPGLRLGWIESSPNNIKILEQTGYIQSGGGLNPFTSTIVGSYIRSGKQKELIQHLCNVYRRRCRVMTEALELDLGAIPVTVEQILNPVVSYPCYVRVTGGFFLWLRFPTHWKIDTKDFLETCLQREEPVSFCAGHSFSLGTPLEDDSSWCTDNAIRICFAYLNETDISNGICRLAKAAYETAESLGTRS